MLSDLLDSLLPAKRNQLMYAFEQGIEQTVELDGYIIGVNIFDTEAYKGLQVVEEAGAFVLYSNPSPGPAQSS